MDYLETLATFGTQDAGQTKHRKLKRLATPLERKFRIYL